MRLPEAEVSIDPYRVLTLLREQHPDLVELPLRSIDHGWDNVIYRLGRNLAVRLPRRELGARCLVREQTWLPQLASRLPLPTPAPLRIGTPGAGYPWHWSVVPWLEGVAADLAPLDSSQAAPLMAFLRALHVPAPAEAPENDARGVPLAHRSRVMMERLHEARLDARLQRLWEDAVTSDAAFVRTWLHGDLHARNVLTHRGRITAIIDWGDVCAGDCATDLAALWMLLNDRAARERAMTLYPASTATWARARGWALYFGVMLAGMREPTESRYRAMGEETLGNLLEGP